MGPDGMHPQVLGELADVIARPLLIIFDQSWQLGETPKDWRKTSVPPIFKEGLGNYSPVSLTSIPGKVIEQLILGNISRHMKDKKVIGNSLQGFTSFYHEMTDLVDQERAVSIIYLDTCKVFDTVSHNILIDRLLMYGLDEQVGSKLTEWLGPESGGQWHKVYLEASN
ncbi:mitochondrial enolase superfamily member 1 [Grus japonensis]|uniref:Mitochondrial enolase superfamily member 1 n=1 Tax=Grus japonensis TaxID=30415 RepID=A0ABC9YCR3_GRUJA